MNRLWSLYIDLSSFPSSSLNVSVTDNWPKLGCSSWSIYMMNGTKKWLVQKHEFLILFKPKLLLFTNAEMKMINRIKFIQTKSINFNSEQFSSHPVSCPLYIMGCVSLSQKVVMKCSDMNRRGVYKVNCGQFIFGHICCLHFLTCFWD